MADFPFDADEACTMADGWLTDDERFELEAWSHGLDLE